MDGLSTPPKTSPADEYIFQKWGIGKPVAEVILIKILITFISTSTPPLIYIWIEIEIEQARGVSNVWRTYQFMSVVFEENETPCRRRWFI